MDQLFLEACDLLDQNKLEEAQRLFEDILQQDEKSYFALNKIGVIHARQNSPDKAHQAFEAALAINPDFAPAIVNKGNLLLERGEYQASIDCYKDAITKDPEYYLAYYNIAIAYKKQNNLNEYLKNIKKYKKHYNEYLKSKDKAEAARLGSKKLVISGIVIVLLVLFLILR